MYISTYINSRIKLLYGQYVYIQQPSNSGITCQTQGAHKTAILLSRVLEKPLFPEIMNFVLLTTYCYNEKNNEGLLLLSSPSLHYSSDVDDVCVRTDPPTLNFVLVQRSVMTEKYRWHTKCVCSMVKPSSSMRHDEPIPTYLGRIFTIRTRPVVDWLIGVMVNPRSREGRKHGRKDPLIVVTEYIYSTYVLWRGGHGRLKYCRTR